MAWYHGKQPNYQGLGVTTRVACYAPFFHRKGW